GLERIGAKQPYAGPALRARLGQHELAAVGEAQPEDRCLRSLLAGLQVAQPSRAHQVHVEDELAVVGREDEPLRAPSRALESFALERGDRWIERLERGDV